MNVYSDSSHLALKYLKDTEVNINNLLIMTGDFNIKNSLWDPSFSHHSSISDNLIIIADSFNLDLLTLTNPTPTRYSNTEREANSVIDLMFFCSGSTKLNNHSIHPNWRLLSDHTSLTVTIPISEEYITLSRLSIPKKSEEEAVFVKEAIAIIKNLDISNLTDSVKPENILNLFRSRIEQAWVKNAKQTRITKHSKQWWNKECSQALNKYRTSRSLGDWKSFKKLVKTTKRTFFDIKIQEIANKSQGSWELMSWVNKHKLPAIKAIKYDNQPCLTLNSLWNALYSTFNTMLHWHIDIIVLDKIGNKPKALWTSFSKEEFKHAISNCNNSSMAGLDKLLWNYLKSILNQDKCLSNIINIADACINLGHWPNHFKKSSTVVISKPNKQSYDYPKSFWPIILLNTLGKLIKKVIGKRLQFHVTANDFIHLSQLEGLKFKSTQILC